MKAQLSLLSFCEHEGKAEITSGMHLPDANCPRWPETPLLDPAQARQIGTQQAHAGSVCLPHHIQGTSPSLNTRAKAMLL